MKLFGSPGSPYARKVRIVLEEKRVAYEYIVESPAAPNSPVPRFNPLGKIPVLVRDDGTAVYDSPVIVEYVDGVGAGPKLIPDVFADRIEVKRWEALGDGIADATVLISHDYWKPEEKRENPEWYEKQTKKIERGLGIMEQELGNREFCYGDRFSLADIAAGYAMGYLDRVWRRIDWRTPHPNLRRLADRLATRDSFRLTLPPPA
ncbi:MAG: glutathione S-transferase N-terminal domain-containing protein [Betaproteobacteria bacterium]|nr:glutathione S-transferase N-terminal domain-containing protein [Betaproteobacteria bacterium]